MDARDAVTLTCSWADASNSSSNNRSSLTECVVQLRASENGMAQAEEVVMTALHATPSPDAFVELRHTPDTTPQAAPWVQLTVASSGVAALCLVVNARVMEIHEAVPQTGSTGDAADPCPASKSSVGSAPLLTQEAQLADPDTGLFAHFLCHGGGGVLFPPHHNFKVKFFGRTPRESICVAAVCVVLEPPATTAAEAENFVSAEGEGEVTDAAAVSASHSSTSTAAVGASGEAAMAELLFTMQRQLLIMERRIGGCLENVMTRLDRLETRVSRLEDKGEDRSLEEEPAHVEGYASIGAGEEHTETTESQESC